MVEAIFGLDSGEANLGVQVQEKGGVWDEAAGGEAIGGGDEFGVEAADDGLVDVGGIGVAVAEDNFAFGEGGADDGLNVVGAIGEEEEEFALGGHGFAVEEEFPDAGSKFAGTGLSGDEHFPAFFTQTVRDGGDGGGLSGSFGSLKRYEHGWMILV